jgi:hypothetical protein
MNDEHCPTISSTTADLRSLEQRLARRPHVLARFCRIADMMDEALVEGCPADETEVRAIEQLQQLGREVLGDWAQEKQVQSLAQARTEHPRAIKHIKKKVSWQTTFGPVAVVEQLLRLGRGGGELRPFCRQAGVQHRGYSRRLQRVLTDFGAEVSFARAVARVREHYGIDVPVEAVRQQTLRHGQAIATLCETHPKTSAQTLITQMDGSMIPVMQPGHGADARKGRRLFWREARLCSARGEGQSTPLYGATLGGVETAAWLWRATAQAAGLGTRTQVHGVGDGAPWIVDKFMENFGAQGRYLLDFYHVSQYLATAAQVIKPKHPKPWLHRQQSRLLENKVAGVLRSLQLHQEDPAAADQPVRATYQYLHQRRQHLDYATARAQGLPIGSGEIESGHRHVIQQRLKLAGCWWKETHAQSMLNLRVARANNLWSSYWSKN